MNNVKDLKLKIWLAIVYELFWFTTLPYDRRLCRVGQKSLSVYTAHEFRNIVLNIKLFESTFENNAAPITAGDLLHKFDVFPTDRRLPMPFWRSVMPVESIFFSSQSTLVLALFFPGNALNRHRQLQLAFLT